MLVACVLRRSLPSPAAACGRRNLGGRGHRAVVRERDVTFKTARRSDPDRPRLRRRHGRRHPRPHVPRRRDELVPDGATDRAAPDTWRSRSTSAATPTPEGTKQIVEGADRRRGGERLPRASAARATSRSSARAWAAPRRSSPAERATPLAVVAISAPSRFMGLDATALARRVQRPVLLMASRVTTTRRSSSWKSSSARCRTRTRRSTTATRTGRTCSTRGPRRSTRSSHSCSVTLH